MDVFNADKLKKARDVILTGVRKFVFYYCHRKSDFSKPGFQFRQIYLQQVGKKKKSKKKSKKNKKEEKPSLVSDSLFSSDSENDEKDVRHVSKAVNNVLNSMHLDLFFHL